MPQQATDTLPDEALMAAIARRDEDAFGQLYDRYSPLLYAICLRIVRRPHDAQAVLSDVCWEIWHHADRFNPDRGSARTYLVMLARSRAVDRLRSESGRQNCEAAFFHSQTRNRADWQLDGDPARLAVAEEDRRRVVAALAELPDAQQRVLQLAYFEGLSQREIATQLGAPLGTVKTHVRTGLARLRRTLRTFGNIGPDRER